ncbi:MAG: hypothetical protein V3T08_09205 [Gemmatimonadota bacterium]
MRGHTPGPWSIERESDRLLIRNRVGYVADLLVGGPNPDANAQNEANALLIKAVPELLAFVVETLENAQLALADRGKLAEVEVDDLYDLLEAMAGDAVDLIAKAEGVAS